MIKRLVIKNGKMVGFSSNKRELTASDMVNFVSVPKKLGVKPFGRELKRYIRRA